MADCLSKEELPVLTPGFSELLLRQVVHLDDLELLNPRDGRVDPLQEDELPFGGENLERFGGEEKVDEELAGVRVRWLGPEGQEVGLGQRLLEPHPIERRALLLPEDLDELDVADP